MNEISFVDDMLIDRFPALSLSLSLSHPYDVQLQIMPSMRRWKRTTSTDQSLSLEHWQTKSPPHCWKATPIYSTAAPLVWCSCDWSCDMIFMVRVIVVTCRISISGGSGTSHRSTSTKRSFRGAGHRLSSNGEWIRSDQNRSTKHTRRKGMTS